MNAEDTLKKVPIFAGLEGKHLKRLANIMVERSFKPGEVIVKEGDQGAGVFLISSGKVEVVKDSQVLNTLGPGDFFGEMALFEGFPRSATVRAAEDTACLAMTRWDFRAELNQNADVALAVLETVVRRLREADQRLTE
jgi:CRP/FNR family cyclic AMP-dependent transcriptional regulator